MHPLARPRRNRATPAIRRLVRETRLSVDQLVYPLFLHADDTDTPIAALPGQTRWSLQGLLPRAQETADLGIPAVALFPKIDPKLKDPTGAESANPDGLIPQAVRLLKQHLPDLLVITDVALDPYNADGHDGIVNDQGLIENDPSVEALCKQALTHADAGADLVAPSDMMDGRVAAIRQTLDTNHHQNTAILSYTAKYASAFYGPFRDALDSAPPTQKPTDSIRGPAPPKPIPTNKSTYQMDPANRREAHREADLDAHEGADILMVKPALPYLDVLRDLRELTPLPLAAYHVSGEYAMLQHAAAANALDLRDATLESLTAIARAGADLIFTYSAPEAAQWLNP
ncbi:MAG: porphobilinogen synthase [Planctomycetota bacterium]